MQIKQKDEYSQVFLKVWGCRNFWGIDLQHSFTWEQIWETRKHLFESLHYVDHAAADLPYIIYPAYMVCLYPCFTSVLSRKVPLNIRWVWENTGPTSLLQSKHLDWSFATTRGTVPAVPQRGPRERGCEQTYLATYSLKIMHRGVAYRVLSPEILNHKR